MVALLSQTPPNNLDTLASLLLKKPDEPKTLIGKMYAGVKGVMRYITCYKRDEFTLRRYAEVFNQSIAHLERYPIVFPLSEIHRIRYEKYISVGTELIRRMKPYKKEKTTKARASVAYHMRSLQFRCEFLKPADEPYPGRLKEICGKAEVWMKSKIHFTAEPVLTKKEKERLSDLCCYQEFAHVMIQDENLQELAFTWILQNGNTPETLVEFASTVGKIIKCNMASRMSFGNLRISGKDEQERGGSGTKDLQIRCKASSMQSSWQSILNPDGSICLQGLLFTKVQTLFNRFAELDYRFSTIEAFAGGFGSWDQVNWSQPSDIVSEKIPIGEPGWEKSLPPVAWLTLQQAKERYEPIDLEGGEARVGLMRGMRGSKEYATPLNNHVSLEIAIPALKNEEPGYHVYPFTIYPKKLPQAWFLYPWASVRAGRGFIGYPDNSIFNTEAQHGGEAFLITEDPFEAIAKYRELHTLCYQLVTWNCATLAINLRKELGGGINPELFTTTLAKVKVYPCLDIIRKWVLSLPQNVQDLLFSSVFSFFGANTEVMQMHGERPKLISIMDHKPWRNPFNLPSAVPESFYKRKHRGMLPQPEVERIGWKNPPVKVRSSSFPETIRLLPPKTSSSPSSPSKKNLSHSNNNLSSSKTSYF
jgi:hypothetical protein